MELARHAQRRQREHWGDRCAARVGVVGVVVVVVVMVVVAVVMVVVMMMVVVVVWSSEY